MAKTPGQQLGETFVTSMRLAILNVESTWERRRFDLRRRFLRYRLQRRLRKIESHFRNMDDGYGAAHRAIRASLKDKP